MVGDCINKQEKMIHAKRKCLVTASNKRKWLATASNKRKWLVTTANKIKSSNPRENGWWLHQARENDPTQPGLPPRTDQYPTLGPSLNLSRHPFEINIQAGIELTYVLKYFDDEKNTDFLQRVPSEAHLNMISTMFIVHLLFQIRGSQPNPCTPLWPVAGSHFFSLIVLWSSWLYAQGFLVFLPPNKDDWSVCSCFSPHCLSGLHDGKGLLNLRSFQVDVKPTTESETHRSLS